MVAALIMKRASNVRLLKYCLLHKDITKPRHVTFYIFVFKSASGLIMSYLIMSYLLQINQNIYLLKVN